MADIKGIKLNGNILTTFSTAGGGVYRHSISFRDVDDGYRATIYSVEGTSFNGKKLSACLGDGEFAIACKISEDRLTFGYVVRYGDTVANSVVNTTSGHVGDYSVTRDVVTQVPFPFM